MLLAEILVHILLICGRTHLLEVTDWLLHLRVGIRPLHWLWRRRVLHLLHRMWLWLRRHLLLHLRLWVLVASSIVLLLLSCLWAALLLNLLHSLMLLLLLLMRLWPHCSLLYRLSHTVSFHLLISLLRLQLMLLHHAFETLFHFFQFFLCHLLLRLNFD